MRPPCSPQNTSPSASPADRFWIRSVSRYIQEPSPACWVATARGKQRSSTSSPSSCNPTPAPCTSAKPASPDTRLTASAASAWQGQYHETRKARLCPPRPLAGEGWGEGGKLSVRDNILLAQPQHPGERIGRALLTSAFHRERDAADQRKTDTLLEEFFLAQVADQTASEIFYGQQKLLTLACCAAMDASLLLLDEPVAGISPEFRERIAERLDSLKAAGKPSAHRTPGRFSGTYRRCVSLPASRKLHRFDTLDQLRAAPVAHDAFV